MDAYAKFAHSRQAENLRSGVLLAWPIAGRDGRETVPQSMSTMPRHWSSNINCPSLKIDQLKYTVKFGLRLARSSFVKPTSRRKK
jgi:hypothetical protein